jgi:7-cyano-7-deazaguanine synthase
LLKEEKAIVVFSGGQDSTTCLFWALQTFKEVEAVTFDYHQRHKKEIDCAKSIAEELKVKHHILDINLLNQLAPSSLTRSGMEIKAGENGGLPNSFVPGRNLIFLSMAAILAGQIGAKHLVTGVCETDFSGYPDCRDAFIKSLNVTINLAMDQNFVIHTPLMWLDKAATWKMAEDLHVLQFIKERTLTCYEGIIGDGCGECPACLLRKRGYEKFMKMKNNQ